MTKEEESLEALIAEAEELFKRLNTTLDDVLALAVEAAKATSDDEAASLEAGRQNLEALRAIQPPSQPSADPLEIETDSSLLQ